MAKETENKDLILQEVIQSLEFLIENQKYGFVILAMFNQIEIGSLMITYEYNVFDQVECFWIQSVYVMQEYRNKGIFKQLYKFVEGMAKDKQTSIKLYAELENQKAINVYEKLGLKKQSILFIEKDYYFDKNIQDEQIKDLNYKIQPFNSQNDKINENNFIFNYQSQNRQVQKFNDNYTILKIIYSGELIGYAFLFFEFSDWRNSFIAYVYELLTIKEEDFEKVSNFLMNYIKNCYKKELKITTIRNIVDITKEKQIQILNMQGFQKAHYYLMNQQF